MPFLIPIVAGIVWLVTSEQRRRRTRECAAWAASHGFDFAGGDPCGLDEVEAALFRRGRGRRWGNVMTTDAGGAKTTLADYRYTVGSGKHARTYHFSIAVMHLRAYVPWVEIRPETLASRLADAVGLDDIQFESGAFNDRFLVKSEDREFAYKLIDARMMEWLLATGAPIFEVCGSHALVAFDRLHVSDFDALTSHVEGFVTQIPRLVLTDYATESR